VLERSIPGIVPYNATRSTALGEAYFQATQLQAILARELCARGRVRGCERDRVQEAAALVVEATLILRRLIGQTDG
jgi:hypothetical protein